MFQENNKRASITFVIEGEPAPKANSRRMVTIKGSPRLIKSKKALDYCKNFQLQCPVLEEPFEVDVSVTLHIYYATRRPDLDESIVLDEMQDRIYKNDRQVKEKHVYWHLDRDRPRAEICVEVMESGHQSSCG